MPSPTTSWQEDSIHSSKTPGHSGSHIRHLQARQLYFSLLQPKEEIHEETSDNVQGSTLSPKRIRLMAAYYTGTPQPALTPCALWDPIQNPQWDGCTLSWRLTLLQELPMKLDASGTQIPTDGGHMNFYSRQIISTIKAPSCYNYLNPNIDVRVAESRVFSTAGPRSWDTFSKEIRKSHSLSASGHIVTFTSSLQHFPKNQNQRKLGYMSQPKLYPRPGERSDICAWIRRNEYSHSGTENQLSFTSPNPAALNVVLIPSQQPQ